MVKKVEEVKSKPGVDKPTELTGNEKVRAALQQRIAAKEQAVTPASVGRQWFFEEDKLSVELRKQKPASEKPPVDDKMRMNYLTS
ncbi:MAG: hypothetical protein KAT71_01710 [Gammaproteobacteria bacterium]|nr:hypothetical protein [Gammaproteobacteria bacterium]